MLSVSAVTDTAGLDALAPAWRAILDGEPALTPFQSYEWLRTWWQHHGAGKLWILVARDGAEVVGLMPLVITRYRGTLLRQVRWMGAPLSDYQGLIAPAQRLAACEAAFLGHLEQHANRWDLCDLNDLRKGDALTGTLVTRLGVTLEHHRVCPYIPLAATWDAFAATLSKNMRTNVGRRRRQVAKNFKAEYHLADAATVDVAMDELFHLHNARWRRRGAMGAFAGARMQRFHHEVARQFVARGWLRLHRLQLDGVTRAAFYCFQRGASVYYYLSGFDTDPQFSKFSLGNVTMAQAIERAIGEGAREFDLLRGDETYKFAWQAQERETVRLIVGHRGLRSRVAVRAHRLERYLERAGLKVQRRIWGRREVARAEERDTVPSR